MVIAVVVAVGDGSPPWFALLLRDLCVKMQWTMLFEQHVDPVNPEFLCSPRPSAMKAL